jgi:hypothetical protein
VQLAYGCAVSIDDSGRATVNRRSPDLSGAPPGWPAVAGWEDRLVDVATACVAVLSETRQQVEAQIAELAARTGGRFVAQPNAASCLWRLAAAATLGFVVGYAKDSKPVALILSVTIGVDILSDPDAEMREARDGLSEELLAAIRHRWESS